MRRSNHGSFRRRDEKESGRRSRRAGFTLVELLVVIAIIGILTATIAQEGERLDFDLKREFPKK